MEDFKAAFQKMNEALSKLVKAIREFVRNLINSLAAMQEQHADENHVCSVAHPCPVARRRMLNAYQT